jgi:serine/threonine-protein kinase
VTISWAAYSCPASTTLDNYSIQIENGTVTSANPAPAGSTSATITLRGDPGDTKVTYTASCSGTPSPMSDVLTLTVP